jgi:A/G-specific adenine glycosylase
MDKPEINHIELPPDQWKRRFQHELLSWYDSEFRDLPWRKTKDPYAIWVSEIMLQQTQVSKVIPYYERFLDLFPTVNQLAAAPLSKLLKAWEGLGYYARARNMHRCADEVCRRYGGSFPTEIDSVRGLPGIGPYTAAAILSISSNGNFAVVDGNVIRVLSRLFRISSSPYSAAGKRTMDRLADDILTRGRAGDHNQAMMELGAVVCRPQNPQCEKCPVSRLCAACRHGDPLKYPAKKTAKKRPHHELAAGIVWRNGKILIARRPEKGLLGGLWEFPGGRLTTDESPEEGAVRSIAKEVGISVKVIDHFKTIDHQYSHFEITLHAFHCDYIDGEPRALLCDEWRWVTLAETEKFAFSRANGKILQDLKKSKNTPQKPVNRTE